MTNTLLFLIGETVLVVGAVFTSYLRTKVQIAQLEVSVLALKQDHITLSGKIEGISRHLSELTGQLKVMNK